MSSAFEHAVSDKASASQAYQSFLLADKQLEALLGNLPRWLRADAGGERLPDRVEVRPRSLTSSSSSPSAHCVYQVLTNSVRPRRCR